MIHLLTPGPNGMPIAGRHNEFYFGVTGVTKDPNVSTITDRTERASWKKFWLRMF